MWTKVHEILRQCRRPFVFSSSFTDCVRHVSFRRYSPFSLEVFEKPNKYIISFLAPNFLEETTPIFLWQIVCAIYCSPFGKVWLSSVCWSPSAKPSNEEFTYRASSYANAVLGVVILSVRPFVTRVLCDKTKQCTADILIPHERGITLVFWLVGDAPFCVKFGLTLKVTHPLWKTPTLTDFRL